MFHRASDERSSRIVDGVDAANTSSLFTPIDASSPLAPLRAAGAVLGIEAHGTRVAEWLGAALQRWRERFIRS